MVEINEVEKAVLQVFRVTGFFNKTPKKDVSRGYVGVARGLEANGVEMEISVAAQGLKSLAAKGLLRLDEEKGIAYLTDKGYAIICG